MKKASSSESFGDGKEIPQEEKSGERKERGLRFWTFRSD